MYNRRRDGIFWLSWTTAQGLPIRPETLCASSVLPTEVV
jgi:hypothetical protein